MGVFVPELVLLAAWLQFNKAREGQEKFKTHENRAWFLRMPSNSARHLRILSQWVATSSDRHLKGFPKQSRYLKIAYKSVIKLYEGDFIKDKDLDPAEVDDKSKADSLAKFLTCIQALVCLRYCDLAN